MRHRCVCVCMCACVRVCVRVCVRLLYRSIMRVCMYVLFVRLCLHVYTCFHVNLPEVTHTHIFKKLIRTVNKKYIISMSLHHLNFIHAYLHPQINDFGLNYMMQSLPFGGIKQSGFGRFAGIEGLRACCYAKAVTDDRTSLIQTWIPGPLQYPIKGVSEGFGLALIRLSYAQSPVAFVKALFAMMCLKEKK